ncbi:ABC transporter substrate-binding protein [Streptomyces badius]
MPAPRTTLRRSLAATLTLPLLISALGACGYGSQAKGEDKSVPVAKGEKVGGLDEVKVGYFANITHATALVGLQEGFFQKELGGTRIKPQVFNAGPSEIEALNAEAIDVGWIGPSPAINGYTRSKGRNLRIISGSASGGVSLVVNPDRIASLHELRGKRLATPQLGNTQDVALLHYLAEKKLTVDPTTGKGEVTVLRQDNKEIPNSFKSGAIDGAWVPEPTASRLLTEGGKVLLDERTLWKDGKFVITNVIASQNFLTEHPDVAEALLRASVKTNAWIKANPEKAKASVNARLKRDAGKELPAEVLDAAFKNVEVTDDPLAASLRDSAEHAVGTGLLKDPLLDGIYDLRPLNRVLKAAGGPAVLDAGLGIK